MCAYAKGTKDIPPKRIEFEETDTIIDHTWPFSNDQFLSAPAGAGNDHVELLERFPGSVREAQQGLYCSSINSFSKNLDSKKAKRLPPQVIPLWDLLKGNFLNSLAMLGVEAQMMIG